MVNHQDSHPLNQLGSLLGNHLRNHQGNLLVNLQVNLQDNLQDNHPHNQPINQFQILLVYHLVNQPYNHQDQLQDLPKSQLHPHPDHHLVPLDNLPVFHPCNRHHYLVDNLHLNLLVSLQVNLQGNPVVNLRYNPLGNLPHSLQDNHLVNLHVIRRSQLRIQL